MDPQSPGHHDPPPWRNRNGVALATARRPHTFNNDSDVDMVIFFVSSLLGLCTCLLLLCWLGIGLGKFCIEGVLSNNQLR